MKEFNRSKSHLEKLAGHRCEFFAYPFGESRHYKVSSNQLALESGYKGVVLGGGGRLPVGGTSLIDRIKVEEEPLSAFACRIEGVSLRSIWRNVLARPSNGHGMR